MQSEILCWPRRDDIGLAWAACFPSASLIRIPGGNRRSIGVDGQALRADIEAQRAFLAGMDESMVGDESKRFAESCMNDVSNNDWIATNLIDLEG